MRGDVVGLCMEEECVRRGGTGMDWVFVFMGDYRVVVASNETIKLLRWRFELRFLYIAGMDV